MKKKTLKIKKKFKYFLVFYFIIVFFTVIFFTYSKYASSLQKTGSLSIAKPIIEINNDETKTDIVIGTSVTRYFSVSNFNDTQTTDVGLDYYLYVVDEDGNVITDATLYYQIDDNNPNEYDELSKITVGEYKGFFEKKDFTTTKETHNYKLVVDHISSYSKIEIKVKAIQKKVL